MPDKKSFLETLAERPVVGDGSYVVTLEKRGYVHGGPYTPEAIVQYPDAVKQLHLDYLRAGADVIQTFSFYATDGKLDMGDGTKHIKGDDLNQAAADIALEVAGPAGAFICGGISPTSTYDNGKGDKEAVKEQFRKQCDIFTKHRTDFLLAEFFPSVAETEIAIGIMKETGLPVAATMRVGPAGDYDDVSPGECAVRMAKAGADIVGVNCSFDPTTSIAVLKLMKAALDAANLHPFLMMQPVGFHCPEVVNTKDGYHTLPEYPFALEPRLLTRWDVRAYVREAYDLGVRYFGGCCGHEPYHVREIAAELSKERGFDFPGKDKYSYNAEGLKVSSFPNIRRKANSEFWMSVKPSSGRPDCPVTAIPETS